MANKINEIFQNIPDSQLMVCILELESNDGVVPSEGEFRKIVESVREITQSSTYSTDFLLCQTNIYRQGALRFCNLKNK